MRPHLIALTLALSATLPVTAHAAWTLNGVPLCFSPNDQNRPIITSDGAGGAIVTWYDHRSGDADIYVQRLDAFGDPLWTANGVALCVLTSDQRDPRIVSDGAGGAIVTWQDGRNGVDYDLYAQRVNAAGVPQWTVNGVAVCTSVEGFWFGVGLGIASDGAGGAIVAWHDYRSGADADIYAQRVNASGVAQWTPNGVPLCTVGSDQFNETIVSDGAGGAIVAWHDYRSGADADIYAQRVNASGVPQWTMQGAAVCTDLNFQFYSVIASDGAGGVIVAWRDYRDSWDIYAQRMNAAGVALWAVNGVALCNAEGTQDSPMIDSDGAGGAIVAWLDGRNGLDYDVYAQRVDGKGDAQWFPNGVALCSASSNQERLSLASDGAGGAIVTWDEVRTATYDVYAQRVNDSGIPVWTPDGIAVAVGAGDAQSATIAPNGAGGAMITWNDSRLGTYDIFAQRIEGRYGEFGLLEPTVVSAGDNPSDQGGKIILRWRGSGRDRFDDPYIALYSIWRATDFAAASAAGSEASLVSDPREIGPDFSGVAIWTEMTPMGPEYWEWIGNQSATYQPTYSLTASTRQDSVATNPATHYFKVIAHESTAPQTRMWESATVSARSVDNLAPAAPLMLIAQRTGPDVHLRWNRAAAPDLRDYSVYRATTTGVTPVPINFLSSSGDTLAVDTGAPTSALYYIVTAHDVHANQSAPSNEASVGATTGIGHTPSIAGLTVLENMPNPFAAATTLRVGLPKASGVEIDVFDVAGRRVGGERTSTLAAGWREISFKAHDTGGRALPSGVYFYRVKAAGETITRKMVIAR